MKCLALVAISLLMLTGAASLSASEGVADVLRLKKAEVSNEIQLAFVQNSKTPFDPTAAEIETLEQSGVSATVILAMINRGNALKLENNATPDTSRAATSDPAPRSEADARYQATASRYADDETVATAALYTPPSDELNISYFYGSLAPYGTWHNIAGRGYSWRPSVALAEHSWRPYGDSGHWVWTNHGWYWESEYPWGWAAFHYGRWNEDPEYGWVWSPDTVWGPAWVNWRYSDSHYGWAPLPREARYEIGIGFSYRDRHVGLDFDFGLNERSYLFVPSESFLDVNLALVAVPRTRVTNIYNTTTINNNYVYNDNRIINQGVPVQSVAQRTHTRVDPLQVTDLQVAEGQTLVRGEVRDQKRIRAYRPTIRNEAPLEPKQASAQFQTRLRAAAERAPGTSRERLSTGGRNATESQGRAGAPSVTAQSEAQARQRLEIEKSLRGKKGDNKDDVHSGKVDRVGDGNSGQGDDLHKPEWGQKGGKGGGDEKAANQRLQEEKARREAEANSKARQSQAEEAKHYQDAEQRNSEVKARHEVESKAQQEQEKPRHPQQAEPRVIEEKARRAPEPEVQQQKAKEAPRKAKEPDVEAPAPDEEKDHSSGPQGEGRGKKGR